MVRGGSFYAIWDEKAGLWSTDEYDVARLVDEELQAEADRMGGAKIRTMRDFSSKSWLNFRALMKNISDNAHQLDETLTFADQPVGKSDYISRRLPYSLDAGDYSSWDELVGTLYSVEERRKIEWAIGSIVSGDSKKIQKFFVFYGKPGSGKSTVMSIVEKLFEGYTATFEAKALGSNNGAFATEAFRSNPLVAIQHDGDLSRIEDNTKLNSIVAHEDIRMNEKYKASYVGRVNALLFMGTNQPVKISDAKSGIIRRLVDIHPTGVLIPPNHYNTLISRIDFELGSIAQHCLDVYRAFGKNYYNSYRPTNMMYQTDIIFNFVEASYDVFKFEPGITLKRAYDMYKEYCSTTGIERPIPQYKFREELRNYFDDFKDRIEVDGQQLRSYFTGFNTAQFKQVVNQEDQLFSLVIEDKVSLLDQILGSQLAQVANSEGKPQKYWTDEERLIDGILQKPRPDQIVNTTLNDIDTREEHYVMVPQNHIVIDFDLKGENGGKALGRNLEAASAWPPTYAELSKSGEGVHLHYYYDGDVTQLSRLYSEGIEVKVFTGKASLRRRLTKCNTVPVATINSGLPIKEKSKVLSEAVIRSEKGLRDLIARNFRKEIHPGTKSSIDFIAKILEEAYASGLTYDVSDLKPKVVAFANNSTNQALACLKIVQRMRFCSDEVPMAIPNPRQPVEDDAPIVFFDVEVFPNLFLICWKAQGSDTVVRMVNPIAKDMEPLLKLKLVGFYNRRFDNHMIYGCYMGYDNQQLYELSQRLISNKSGSTFAAAYNLSYTDIWDFSSKKQSLKKFEIELGLPHMELDIPWDQPVPKELWKKVEEYCVNDVLATEATFEDRKQDFVARQILAELSGLTVNDSTAKHTAQIIFEGDRNPAASFLYTDLSEEFVGYEFDAGKSTFMGEEVGEGGYVYAEPGMYSNVALLDVASMHPTSLIHLNMFGDKYTRNFKGLMDARLAIKHRDFETAGSMLDGKLARYLGDDSSAKDLSYALKIIINIVYGLTSATFDSPFRDKRNKDNIAAKRGALFMIQLKHYVQELGYKVVHIKTDSIKIANVDDEIIDLVFEYGEKYGYTFEHEGTYQKFCLVNDAVYIAKTSNGNDVEWTAVGTQFKVPYVFKTLFLGEPILRQDLAETKQVSKGHMVLNFDSGPVFVGRTGRFVPVTEESGVGGTLVRKFEDKEYAVAGTKGYKWVEATNANNMDGSVIDRSYFDRLANEAKATIEKFGSFEEFVS
jgi:energy-coupling factor transporter ATP-binding protein EcfA2